MTQIGWFRHRASGGPERLGLAMGEDRFDLLTQLGRVALDEVAALEAGLLTGDGLRRLADSASERDRLPPEFPYAPPVARPGKILCLGKNFAAHAAEFGAAVPEEPMFFAKLPETLLPHRGTVRIPRGLATRVDHEVELCVVLRGGGKHVAREAALALVGGYTVLNDITARTMQGEDRKEQKPWLRSKSFDTFCPVGPIVRAREDLPEPLDLRLTLSVNGVVKQDSRTSRMVVGVAEALAFLSRHTTLRAGDLIAMGTPEGVSPVKPGDVMRAEIEAIGVLENPVAAE
jgi:5-oxopent-3-ene-1,2,5-tricarboxylate decarboxylase/2-hydroxyhepta-2,4-diene-1,7-dioate isomerase